MCCGLPAEIHLAAVSIGRISCRRTKADFSLSAVLQAVFSLDGLCFFMVFLDRGCFG